MGPYELHNFFWLFLADTPSNLFFFYTYKHSLDIKNWIIRFSLKKLPSTTQSALLIRCLRPRRMFFARIMCPPCYDTPRGSMWWNVHTGLKKLCKVTNELHDVLEISNPGLLDVSNLFNNPHPLLPIPHWKEFCRHHWVTGWKGSELSRGCKKYFSNNANCFVFHVWAEALGCHLGMCRGRFRRL